MNPDHEAAHLIRTGIAEAVAWGEVTWVPLNGTWRGRVESCASKLSDVQLEVEFQVRPGRPNEPSVLVLAGSLCLLRLDHNQVHQGRWGTHIQSSADRSLLMWPQPEDAGSPPATGEVSAQQVKIACLKGAAVLGVNTKGVIWIDPPDGV